MSNVLKSPMGVWGKKVSITETNKVETICSHPELLEMREGAFIIQVKESLREPLVLTHSGNDALVRVRVVT